MTNAQLIASDPGWLIAVKALIVFAICVLLTLMSVWGERRVVGRMQQRPGPNRVGPFGLIQALADGAHNHARALYGAAEPRAIVGLGRRVFRVFFGQLAKVFAFKYASAQL